VTATEFNRSNIGSWVRMEVVCNIDGKLVYGQVRDYNYKADTLAVQTSHGMVDYAQEHMVNVDGALAMLLYESKVPSAEMSIVEMRKNHVLIVERILGDSATGVEPISAFDDILEGIARVPTVEWVEWCEPLTGCVVKCGLDHVVRFMRYHNQDVPDDLILGSSFCDDPVMRAKPTCCGFCP